MYNVEVSYHAQIGQNAYTEYRHYSNRMVEN